MTASITKSVGRGCANVAADVTTVQSLLNLALEEADLKETGKMSNEMVALIDFFQSRWMHVKADGKISPNGATFIALNKRAEVLACEVDNASLPANGAGTAISEADYATAAGTLGVDIAAVKAVAEVESKGAGFFPSGRPKILFEAHIFSKYTFHVFDKKHPNISSKTWNKKLYVGGDAEYDRLQQAMMLDRRAALMSASWGAFQIMGFNYGACGYADVEAMITDMFTTEGAHLQAFVKYIKSTHLDAKIKAKDWAGFASAYNGPGYAENKYDEKMAKAYKAAGGK